MSTEPDPPTPPVADEAPSTEELVRRIEELSRQVDAHFARLRRERAAQRRPEPRRWA